MSVGSVDPLTCAYDHPTSLAPCLIGCHQDDATALYFATLTNKLPIVEALLRRGADPTAKANVSGGCVVVIRS